MNLFSSGRYARYNVTTQTGAYNAQPGDLVLCSTNSFTVTLPAAAGSTGQTIKIINTINDLSKLITISPNLKGASRTLNSNNESVEVISDGTNWQVLNHDTNNEWAAYTPAITQLGTVASVSFFSRRVGDSLQVMGKWKNGPSGLGGTEVRIPFPANITSDSTKLPAAIQVCGNFDSANGGANNYSLLVEPSVTYFTFARSNLTKAVGSVLNVDEDEQIFGTFPVSGWWS